MRRWSRRAPWRLCCFRAPNIAARPFASLLAIVVSVVIFMSSERRANTWARQPRRSHSHPPPLFPSPSPHSSPHSQQCILSRASICPRNHTTQRGRFTSSPCCRSAHRPSLPLRALSRLSQHSLHLHPHHGPPNSTTPHSRLSLALKALQQVFQPRRFIMLRWSSQFALRISHPRCTLSSCLVFFEANTQAHVLWFRHCSARASRSMFALHAERRACLARTSRLNVSRLRSSNGFENGCGSRCMRVD